jgi:lipoprotein-releasing system ATP-binding protein
LNNTSIHTATKDDKPVLDARSLWKSYEQGTIPVLNGVSLSAYARQTVALCGPSGCGKSTLLHMLGGLDEPTSGTVMVNGRELKRGRSVRDLLRHEIGFVFQLHNLLPDLTLEENCMIPAVAKGTPRAAAMERFNYLAERTGLSHRHKQRIQKLSGGERQRTALCRALMNKPAILIADEPTGSLDEKTSGQVFDLLMELVETEGITLVMATHDRGLAKKCGRQVEMHDGKIVE